MTQSEPGNIRPSVQDVALIIGGGPRISASCAKLFAENDMRVGIAARNPDKPVLQRLETTHGVRRYACDASEPASGGVAVPECCSGPWSAYACGAQHRWPGSGHFSQGDCGA
jgi:NAD(P)-dependent dehydrogenase (short-subunit alcohol dehydrogenase family)